MSKKTPFLSKDKAEEIIKDIPTPFHIYDEAGIRRNCEAVKKAFAWNPGFREYFAVKANPNPYILKIMSEYDFGFDCSSEAELVLSEAVGADGAHIMFSSNETPARDVSKQFFTIDAFDIAFAEVERLLRRSKPLPIIEYLFDANFA